MMFSRLANLTIFTILMLVMAGSTRATSFKPWPHIVIFAAASTTEAVTDIARLYEAENAAKVTLIFAGTPDLFRQIQQGTPPADAVFFLSADEKWMDEAEKRDFLMPATRFPYLTTELALIAPADSTWQIDEGQLTSLPGILADGRLAIGDPDSVPAGRYAKGALENLHLWDYVKDRIAPTTNVRAALTLVGQGEAAAGIVYEADILADTGHTVRKVMTLPRDSYPQPIYPIAALKPSDPSVVLDFENFLREGKTAAVLERYGFRVIGWTGNAQ